MLWLITKMMMVLLRSSWALCTKLGRYGRKLSRFNGVTDRLMSLYFIRIIVLVIVISLAHFIGVVFRPTPRRGSDFISIVPVPFSDAFLPFLWVVCSVSLACVFVAILAPFAVSIGQGFGFIEIGKWFGFSTSATAFHLVILMKIRLKRPDYNLAFAQAGFSGFISNQLAQIWQGIGFKQDAFSAGWLRCSAQLLTWAGGAWAAVLFSPLFWQ